MVYIFISVILFVNIDMPYYLVKSIKKPDISSQHEGSRVLLCRPLYFSVSATRNHSCLLRV